MDLGWPWVKKQKYASKSNKKKLKYSELLIMGSIDFQRPFLEVSFFDG